MGLRAGGRGSRCCISAARWNIASSSGTASAPWWKSRTMGPRRAMRRAAPSGSVQRERAATRYRLVGHERHFTFERRAVHMAAVFHVVEGRGAVLRAAVVPEHRVAPPPAGRVDELGAHGEFLRVLDERRAVRS